MTDTGTSYKVIAYSLREQLRRVEADRDVLLAENDRLRRDLHTLAVENDHLRALLNPGEPLSLAVVERACEQWVDRDNLDLVAVSVLTALREEAGD